MMRDVQIEILGSDEKSAANTGISRKSNSIPINGLQESSSSTGFWKNRDAKIEEILQFCADFRREIDFEEEQIHKNETSPNPTSANNSSLNPNSPTRVIPIKREADNSDEIYDSIEESNIKASQQDQTFKATAKFQISPKLVIKNGFGPTNGQNSTGTNNTGSASPSHPLTPNRIKTNGSFIRSASPASGSGSSGPNSHTENPSSSQQQFHRGASIEGIFNFNGTSADSSPFNSLNSNNGKNKNSSIKNKSNHLNKSTGSMTSSGGGSNSSVASADTVKETPVAKKSVRQQGVSTDTIDFEDGTGGVAQGQGHQRPSSISSSSPVKTKEQLYVEAQDILASIVVLNSGGGQNAGNQDSPNSTGRKPPRSKHDKEINLRSHPLLQMNQEDFENGEICELLNEESLDNSNFYHEKISTSEIPKDLDSDPIPLPSQEATHRLLIGTTMLTNSKVKQSQNSQPVQPQLELEQERGGVQTSHFHMDIRGSIHEIPPEKLKKDRRTSFTAISRLKQRLIDLELRSEEEILELENERSLLNGEWKTVSDELLQVKVRLSELKTQEHYVDVELDKMRSGQQSSDAVERVRETLERSERELARLIDIHKTFIGTDEQEAELLKGIHLQRELVEMEKKNFEDAEFRQMEEEAKKEAEKEELAKELSDLTSAMRQHEKQLVNVEEQQRKILAAVRRETRLLEDQRTSLVRQLEMEKLRMESIDKQLQAMNVLSPVGQNNENGAMNGNFDEIQLIDTDSDSLCSMSEINQQLRNNNSSSQNGVLDMNTRTSSSSSTMAGTNDTTSGRDSGVISSNNNSSQPGKGLEYSLSRLAMLDKSIESDLTRISIVDPDFQIPESKLGYFKKSKKDKFNSKNTSRRNSRNDKLSDDEDASSSSDFDVQRAESLSSDELSKTTTHTSSSSSGLRAASSSSGGSSGSNGTGSATSPDSAIAGISKSRSKSSGNISNKRKQSLNNGPQANDLMSNSYHHHHQSMKTTNSMAIASKIRGKSSPDFHSHRNKDLTSASHPHGHGLQHHQQHEVQFRSQTQVFRPLSEDSSAYWEDAESLATKSEVTLRSHSSRQPSQRPLTRYLPVRDEDFDLRHHIETAGHQIELCPHIVLNSSSCRGYLHKMSGSKFRSWNKRWFVFDRRRKTIVYYNDKAEKSAKGGIYFQSIEEVYVDHLNTVKSPHSKLTFCVKTSERTYYLMAPTPEAMRIWVDVIFTGAEGYREFEMPPTATFEALQTMTSY